MTLQTQTGPKENNAEERRMFCFLIVPDAGHACFVRSHGSCNSTHKTLKIIKGVFW